ncbi:MAG: DUF4115 domain-containing protein [Candidatus Omnitrophica bacterium]|nr:DUF4115 domain-containing protein [Candidatus Omnitrophota bacterium]
MKRNETIGGRLKKAREAKSLTLEKAHKDLKIHPRILESLEEDRIDHSIGEIYVKVFLKSYTKYLGLDPNKMLYDYSKTSDTSLRESERDAFAKIGSERKSPPLIIKDRFKKSILPITAGLALILIVSIISYASFRLIAEFKNLNAKRSAASESRTGLPVDSGKAALTIPAAATQKAAEARPVTLKVETTDDAWLRVKSDGNVIFVQTLPKGSVETWGADEELELWVGRAEALELTLNGKRLGSPGRGRIRRLIINKNGFKIGKK